MIKTNGEVSKLCLSLLGKIFILLMSRNEVFLWKCYRVFLQKHKNRIMKRRDFTELFLGGGAIMKVTWLGQAGLLFETNGKTILVDPYLSDKCGELNPKNHRRIPVDEKFFSVSPDVLLITHNHLDHLDEATLSHFLCGEKSVLTLSSPESWTELRKNFAGNNNLVRTPAFCRWEEDEFTITTVPACHSEPSAVGFIIEAEGNKYYITGDTLYNETVLNSLPGDIYAVFLPINGKGNNMNARDAKHFAEQCGAKYAVPLHFGMFDDINPEIFKFKNTVIPEIYKEIIL